MRRTSHLKNLRFTIVLTMLTVCGPVWSLDLLQAFQAAQAGDAHILAARAGAQANQELAPQARAVMMPSVSLSATQFNNQLTQGNTQGVGRSPVSQASYTSTNQTLTLRQPLYRPYLWAQYQQAQAQGREALSGLAQEEQSLVVRVCTQYFDALLAQDQLALVMAQRTHLTTQLAAARQAFAAGSGTRTDIDEAQAYLDMNTARALEARQQVMYTLKQLALLINEPVEHLATLDPARLTLDEQEFADPQTWTDRAEKNNPHLQTLIAQLDIARHDLSKARSGHLPTLDIIAQWTRSENDNVTNINTRYVNAGVGVQLNVPLFSGGYVNAAVRQAAASLQQAQHTLTSGRRDLELQVYKAFRAVTESMARIQALEQALRSADQVVLSNEKSFQAGSRTLVNIHDAQQHRMGVARDLSQARYGNLVARLRLLALVGEADTQAIRAINQLLTPHAGQS